jgi:crotonobetaine/carnitine-CoA ligase
MMGTNQLLDKVKSTPQPPLMPQLLAEWAALQGDKIALQFDEVNLTYGKLDQAANYLAGALQRRGIKMGDRVAIMLANRPEIAIAYFALARLGAIAVPVNTALKGEGLAYIFRQSEPSAVIIEPSFLARVEAALGNLDTLNLLVITGPTETEISRAVQFSQLLAEQQSGDLPQIQPGDPWAIMFTSGTTGPSKGAILPHQMFASLSLNAQEFTNFTSDAVAYTFLPLYHLNAVIFCMGVAIMAGARGVIRERFPQERLLDDLRESGATHTTIPPFVALGLLARPPEPHDQVNPLRYLMTFGLSETQWVAFEQRFGVKILSAYGPTETGLICTLPLDVENKKSSSGRPHARFEVRIVDENDRPLPSGEIGEVVCRSLYPFELMQGYYNNNGATVAAWRNLWFHTGDAGWLDQDGYFYFADRLKDMIKRRGSSVSSFEVEQVLATCPGLREVAVVPYRQPDSGEEEVRAFVIAQEGVTVDMREIISYCASRMAYYMVPRYLDLCQTLPRNPIGKLEKFKLRKEPLFATTFDRKAAGIVLER